MTSIPFVNREEELDQLKGGIESDTSNFFVIRGKSGIGKSWLLKELREHCEENKTKTVWHDIGEPSGKEVFLHRFLNSWDQETPESVIAEIKEKMPGDKLAETADKASPIDPTGGLASITASALFNHALSSSDESVIDATDEVEFTINVLDEDTGINERVLIIIDQYNERDLPEDIVDELDSLFREAANRTPDRITWCIGTDHRISTGIRGPIEDIEIKPFDTESIEELIEKIELQLEVADEDVNLVESTNYDGPEMTKKGIIDEIKIRTKGEPFLISGFLEITDEHDITKAIDEIPFGKKKFKEHIPQEYIKRLNDNEKEVLRSVCVLRQINPKIACYVADRKADTTREVLSRLSDKSLVYSIESSNVDSVYRCHELLREYLVETTREEKKKKLRLRAVIAFSLQASNKDEAIGAELEKHLRKLRKEHNLEPDEIVTDVYKIAEDMRTAEQSDVDRALKTILRCDSKDDMPEKLEELVFIRK